MRQKSSLFLNCLKKSFGAKVQLQAISRIMVADAWFCKVSFINALLKDGFQLVCRLRDDANLRYLYKGPKTGKKSRPPVYAGKVDHKHINDAYFDKVTTQDGLVLQTAILNSVTLKRNIRVVHVKVNQKKETYKLYFSTDTSMSPEQILHYYCSRFQIEFIYRDAKQHTALENAQARGAKKLDFHFNMALSAVNIAKAANWLTIPKEERGAFSMADINLRRRRKLDYPALWLHHPHQKARHAHRLLGVLHPYPHAGSPNPIQASVPPHHPAAGFVRPASHRSHKNARVTSGLHMPSVNGQYKIFKLLF